LGEAFKEIIMEHLYLRIGCDIHYKLEQETPILFVIQPEHQAQQRILEETWSTNPHTPIEGLRDSFGNLIWRLMAPNGVFQLRYDALAQVPRSADEVLPDLDKVPMEQLPGDVVSYLWPSRYCESDLLIGEAWRLFGHITGGWAQVQEICNWMHREITYGAGSTSATSSLEVYNQRRGVCRDFAHLAISFCRALNIPARYVCGFLPDVDVEVNPIPMDFHAWFEAYLDGAWRTFDARHNVPRVGRVVIARGRDAVDCAWSTVFGNAQLVNFTVWADEVAATTRIVNSRPESQAKV
jgi:transglutaminase-like putative cysteine protease